METPDLWKLIAHHEECRAACLIRRNNICYPIILILIYFHLSTFIFWSTYWKNELSNAARQNVLPASGGLKWAHQQMPTLPPQAGGAPGGPMAGDAAVGRCDAFTPIPSVAGASASGAPLQFFFLAKPKIKTTGSPCNFALKTISLRARVCVCVEPYVGRQGI